ncbi:uncharacterized protein LOC126779288 [Nymphalis io]|uniref:uncharacterized protein LOC126779288 n=1 Tax=Inachis io TaxID=171585 RepID=UPI002168803F|nr:uncharacterized protein LOC126779288 [Nymphalis io]
MFVFKIISISVLLGVTPVVSGFEDYDDLYDDENTEYYDDYYKVEDTMPDANDTSSSNRTKRYQDKSTMSLEDKQDVEGALQQLLPNIRAENLFTAPSTESTYLSRYFDESNASTQTYSTINTQTLNAITIDDAETATSPRQTVIEKFTDTLTTEDTFKNLFNQIPKRSSAYVKSKKHTKHLSQRVDDVGATMKLLRDSNTATVEKTKNEIVSDHTTQTEAVTTPSPTTRRDLDIPRLLDIIADLASEFETNLTRKLNETLFNMSIPTCTTPTTEAPTTSEYDANYTGATIAKCFVCGLDIPGIPQHAQCADAFAGDFLPLVPVDASAKGKISSFKKYCKYSNIPGYVTNFTHSRAIYGRWTGGCAVRWVDLSGVYTQRTCRSRLQPTMGKHFASKRMAKLERSLWNIDNGCIISPVATLLPLSRGISLYARFHSCVCTGNWCNSAYVNRPWTSCYLILFVFDLCIAHFSYMNLDSEI